MFDHKYVCTHHSSPRSRHIRREPSSDPTASRESELSLIHAMSVILESIDNDFLIAPSFDRVKGIVLEHFTSITLLPFSRDHKPTLGPLETANVSLQNMILRIICQIKKKINRSNYDMKYYL